MSCERLLSGLIVAMAWHGSASAAPVPDVPRDTVITLQDGGCEHRCAVYKIAIFADGVSLLDSEYYVTHPGPTRNRLSIEPIGLFLRRMEQMGFFDMPNSILPNAGCAKSGSDAHIVVVSILSGGRAKAVVHDRRCAGAAAALMEKIESDINALAGVAGKIR